MPKPKVEATSAASAQGALSTPTTPEPSTQKFDETVKGGRYFKGNPANPIAVNAHGKELKTSKGIAAEATEDEEMLKAEGLVEDDSAEETEEETEESSSEETPSE